METDRKYWIIKRHVVETFQVIAETKEQALEALGSYSDPAKVEIVKEICKQVKFNKPK